MEPLDLYAVDVSEIRLRKLCGGGITNTMESCVAAAIIPGTDAVILGDAKLGADSPTLRFDRSELRNFADWLRANGI